MSTSTTTTSSTTSSYDMYLQLLCTQLQYQNPLDPMDSTDFAQQLATYASLEQQINTNDKLDSLLSSIDTLSMENGVGYLGTTVTADSDTLTVDDDGSVGASWEYTLASSASDVTLTVTDSDGNTVWEGTGETSSGTHTLAWDGTDSSGDAVDAGDYTLTVTATDSSGSAVTASIAIKGTVTSIDSSSGSTVLDLGGTEVDIDDVTAIAA